MEDTVQPYADKCREIMNSWKFTAALRLYLITVVVFNLFCNVWVSVCGGVLTIVWVLW